MTKWEYIRVSYDHCIFDGSGGTILFQEDLDVKINQLGLEGWELVGIDSHDDNNTYYVFKRAITE